MSSFDKLKIPLQEISSATNKFAKANIIGKGGYGEVYLGQSKEHGMLAIKRLNCMHGQGDHEYGMEVTLLSRYKHENLVSLIGFCGEGGEKILVYKYEANQSLDKHLDSKDLSWMRRLHICLEAACGLRYFHNETGCGHGVIHRDIKSSNILLDENWNAKISDFGLSKIALTNSADSVIFTVACGTPGYIDPQILYGCGITQKSDVYSFGVVLYEVLFGKLVAVPGYLGDGRFTYKDSMGVYDAYEESILLPAIKQSRAFIIVFSKNFAASSWNLDEVAEIVKCVKERENVVIPVFGDVHPSEVREQKGYFGEAMSKHDSNPRRGVWRNALVEVADVPGLEASNFRSCEDLAKEAADGNLKVIHSAGTLTHAGKPPSPLSTSESPFFNWLLRRFTPFCVPDTVTFRI